LEGVVRVRGSGLPLAGVLVELDNGRSTRTDAEGSSVWLIWSLARANNVVPR